MKIRSQVGMVLNLDKCIGCHTCSITCKNVWTSREGMEYAWFNNVETKPGIGYPKEWENQEKWKGGWVRAADGSIRPRIGGKFRVLANIFANPDLPEIDDYYEPFDFDYQHLHTAPKAEHQPVARPRSLVSGQRMEKIEWGPNWEEILGTEFAKRRKDKNFDQVQADIYGEYENTFMMYLPRLCEHCLNPACVASCPSGAIYKREEDGIVLIDQDKCRGWRMCISGCPYKKIYFNWKSGKSEKCIFCYPRIEAGQPTVCSETCVGRIRYLGVLLYDAGLSRLNISLDTLDPLRFRAITRNGELDKVLAGIDAAQAAGFRRIKLNAVVMKGRNADEVPALVDFAIARGLDISFIEEMPLGQVGRERGESFCSSDEVRALIAQRHALLDSAEQSGGPARYVRLVEHPQTRIGFISPHSHNFCATCNRLRLTVEGRLLLCLGHEHSLDLRALLRRHPLHDGPLLEAIGEALQRKPARHEFSAAGEVQVLRFMNMSGG